MPMLAIQELLKEYDTRTKTNTERLNNLRLVINNLYNNFDYSSDTSKEQLREQYETSLGDPRRI